MDAINASVLAAVQAAAAGGGGDGPNDTLLVIGRQVITSTGKRMDLVAIDATGALILIEVKRDARDIRARKDHAEIQSVRYAASLAKLRTVDDLVLHLYAPYIQRHESLPDTRTAAEWGRKKLSDFILANDIDRTRLNHAQKIVLVGAAFDPDTKSAAAWMAANGIPMQVIEVRPCTVGDDYFLNIQQVIPVPTYEDFYVDVTTPRVKRTSGSTSSTSTRRQRLRLSDLFDAGKVKSGDPISFKGREETATLTATQKCVVNGGPEMSLLQWTKGVTGWGAVNVYDWVRHDPTGKLLEELRMELEEGDLPDEGSDDTATPGSP